MYDFSVMDMFGFCDAWLVHSFVILLPFRFYFHSNWNVLRSPSPMLVGVHFNLGAGLQS